MSDRVLIVGTGPVGLTVALELAHHGAQSTFETMARDLVRANPLIDFREGFAFEPAAME